MTSTPTPTERRHEHDLGHPRAIGMTVSTPAGPGLLEDISNRQACVRMADSNRIAVFPEGEVYAR